MADLKMRSATREEQIDTENWTNEHSSPRRITMADVTKELKEKQTSNLLKAIELKNTGINNGKLAKIVDYVIDHEIAELQYDVVLFDRGNVKTMDYNFHKEDGRCMKN